VINRNEHIDKNRTRQGAGVVTPEANKIGASTPLDFQLHTLAYYVARYARSAHPRLARVKLACPVAPSGTFTLLLRNGRRIDSAWNFRDADLARLIRIAESE